MTSTQNTYQLLKDQFPNLNFKPNELLGPHLQLGVGGPAEVFWQTTNPADFTQVVSVVKKHQLPLTILGWGSNVLIADRGIKGLVIQNKVNHLNIVNELPSILKDVNPIVIDDARWKPDANSKPKVKNHDCHPELVSGSHNTTLRNSETPESHAFGVQNNTNTFGSQLPTPNSQLIKIFSGTSLPWLINQLLEKNILGLHHFIKIPGTVGGAVVNNIHGGTHLISEFVLGVEVIDGSGSTKILTPDQLNFDYDFSRFHQTDEVITSIYFKLYQGNEKELEIAKKQLEAMLQAKATHEFKSLGCVWQNLDKKTQDKLNLPTPSAGYVIDKLLKLKDFQVGGAQVSTKHAAFITTTSQATASDYLNLMKKINQKAQKELSIKLKPEIFFLGFTKAELAGII